MEAGGTGGSGAGAGGGGGDTLTAGGGGTGGGAGGRGVAHPARSVNAQTAAVARVTLLLGLRRLLDTLTRRR